ncbi:MAG: hypothetical protein IRZ05_18935 [Micromonosporaceae bacterium]|nr:hypothetical protein [Micromonosporaceae bacterium]
MDTTAAGDAFTGSLGAALAAGLDTATAIRRGWRRGPRDHAARRRPFAARPRGGGRPARRGGGGSPLRRSGSRRQVSAAGAGRLGPRGGRHAVGNMALPGPL